MPEVQYLIRQFLVSLGGSIQELSTDRGVWCLLSAGSRLGMAVQQSSPLGGCAMAWKGKLCHRVVIITVCL